MRIILLLIITILPIAILSIYIYDLDNEKESLKLLVKLLVSGILSCVIVCFISGLIFELIPSFRNDPSEMNIMTLLMYTFIGVSLVEEGSKLSLLYMSSYEEKEFDYTFDMIVYAIFVSLGFALFENGLYIFQYGFLTGVSRAFTAVPAHASYGVFMGMFLSKAKCYEVKDPFKSKIYKILSLLVPVLIHGLYDVFAFRNQIGYLIRFIILLFSSSLIFVYKKRKDDMKISQYSIE